MTTNKILLQKKLQILFQIWFPRIALNNEFCINLRLYITYGVPWTFSYMKSGNIISEDRYREKYEISFSFLGFAWNCVGDPNKSFLPLFPKTIFSIFCYQIHFWQRVSGICRHDSGHVTWRQNMFLDNRPGSINHEIFPVIRFHFLSPKIQKVLQKSWNLSLFYSLSFYSLHC